MAQRTGTAGPAPVLVDLGKVKAKAVREFKDGCGPVMDDVQQVLAEVRQGLGTDAATKELVPIVVLYRKKRKRNRGGGLFCF